MSPFALCDLRTYIHADEAESGPRMFSAEDGTEAETETLASE